MRVAVRAWEGFYRGLHGVEDYIVLDVSDPSEIDDWGREASDNLIESYGLENEYFDEDEDDEERTIEDSFYYSDGGWESAEIRDDVTLSLGELNHKLTSFGFRLFKEKYCK